MNNIWGAQTHYEREFVFVKKKKQPKQSILLMLSSVYMNVYNSSEGKSGAVRFTKKLASFLSISSVKCTDGWQLKCIEGVNELVSKQVQ